MNKPAALKKIMSIISMLLLGAGSLGCNGKVFSALLDKDSIPLFAVLALNGGPRVSLTSTPAITIANVGTYSVSGTCTAEGQQVTVVASDGTLTANGSAVCTDRSFSASLPVTGLSDSQTILITADHVNAKGKAARQARATVVKDTAAPGVTISSTAPLTTNLPIPVTITFSEPVTGFELGDITVGNGTAGSFTGSGTTYTAIITPTTDGPVTVDVTAGVALDTVENPNTAATQLARTYDTSSLLVSISSIASDPTNVAIPITITFYRSVTGFESTEIIVGNGSIGSTFSGSGAVYTATITPAGQGEVTVDINAGVAEDGLGYSNIAADQFSITYDSLPPAVTIELPTDTLVNAAQETVFTLTYEAAPTGLDTDDISLTGTTAGCSVSIDDATTTTPDVRISGCSGNGSFTIAVAAGTSQDAAGNADLGDSTSASVTVDNTAPRISSVETAKPDGTYTINEVINIAVEFNEPVTFAGTGATLDVALNSGATLHMPTFSGSSTNINYTVAAGEYTPVTPSALPLDSSGISIAGGGTLTDAAGNAISNFTPLSNISAESTIYIDAVLPAITSAETMDTDADGKIDHYKVTFNRPINDSSFTAGEWDVAGYVITGLDTAIPADVDNDTVLYIEFTELGGTTGDTGAKPDLTTPGTVTLRDSVPGIGNPMAAIPDIDDVVETDKAAPVIMKATGQTGATGLSIEFSEQVDRNGSLGGCPEGGDAFNLTTASFVYTDDSGDGAGSISSMGSDATACSTSGNYAVGAVLDANMETSDLDVDHVAPELNAIRDMGDNWADSGRQVAVTGAVSPYVYDVYANLKQKIRVAFSEPVNNSAASNAESALNHANYSLAENPVESGCSGSGSDTVNIDTATAIVDVNGDGTVFELTTTAAQCSSTTYELTVSQAIIDQNDHVGLVPPYIMTFLGNEQLRVVSGSNIDIQSMVVVFNKSVEAGTGDGGAELTTRYLFNNIPAGTAPTSAVRGSVPNANRVTLGTSFFQQARTYVVIGANGDNLYGFNEGGVGAIKTTTVVSEGAEIPQESLQAYPRDRAPWVGFGTPILNFDDGPLSVDPFGNPVETFGYLASYGGKVYIGPNALGNTTSRMDPDASNPELVYFQFEKDITGTTGNDGETNQASNDDTSRDGGIAVPPYVTIGHTGCTSDTAELNTGCGPDNENGRGVFSSGMIGSTEHIFLGGARTTPDGDDYWFDYVYYTSGTGDTLTFNYVDMGTITGTVTSGLSSNLLFNDRLQVGMAKVNESGGDGNNAPDFGKVSFNTADTGNYCTSGGNCDATIGTYGDRYYINRIDYFGGRDQSGGENTHVNRAYIVGVDALYSFNGRIYAANGGLNYMNRDGGVIRSDGTNYANPGRCDAVDDCPDWLEIAPRSQTEWYNTDQDASGIRFSLELVKLADMIPNDKATPGFAEYEGKLYMIRNTCAVRNANENLQTSAHYTTGCTQNTASDPYDYVASEFVNRQPQLWVCTPGTTGDADECDAGDWALVDDATPDGVTNFGDSGNHSITMVMKSGKYLYVGLDNVNGIQVYRVKTVAGVPVANPTEDDFDRVGTGTPGIDGTTYKEIYSYISIPGTGIYSNYSFLYVSAGKNSTPVAIFIEMGGNTAAYE